MYILRNYTYYSYNLYLNYIEPDKWNEEMQNIFMATLIDGEGHLGFIRRRNHNRCGYSFVPIIHIEMVKKESVQAVNMFFGGYLYLNKHRYKGELRSYWAWRPKREDTLSILKRSTPYLLIKRKQAEELIGYLEKYPYPHKRMTDERLAHCEYLYSTMKNLNSGGHNIVTA